MAPNAANAGSTFENDDVFVWVEFDICSSRSEAIPACIPASVLCTMRTGDVVVLLQTVDKSWGKRTERLAFAWINLIAEFSSTKRYGSTKR